ncbi:MAG TPA: hypothetical protein ENG51_12335 [Deltaproteobacteria bacterium]|nr:MAG: hypothetical protein DRH50_12510 [Deltaproteobacteria bacterium]HDH97908.1 hypothetical protein [Deltaproteobacteria bacterium]HDM77234.1 hypothetical protein [Deltaproteobacteria bacterium]
MSNTKNGFQKNFAMFEEVTISGRPHRRVCRGDDAFEFYVDTFFLELAKVIIEGNFDIYAYARQWSIPISYVEWAKRFLLKERLVVSTHERC